MRDDSREAPHARSLSPWFHSEGLPACRRFLRARCSPGPRSLERVPAWQQEPSVRLLPPKTLYPNLHPCSRRPKKHSDSHPTSSRDPSVHADRARFGGTTRARARCWLASLAAIFASDASVAVPASPPRSLNRARSAGPAKMISTRIAVTQTRASTTRAAFHRCRFERRRSAVLRGAGRSPLSRRRPVSNLAREDGYAVSLAEGFTSPPQARAHPRMRVG